MSAPTDKAIIPGLQPWTIALQDEIAAGKMHCKKTFSVAQCTVEVQQGNDSLWILIWRPEVGGLALRTAYAPGSPIRVETSEENSDSHTFQVHSSLGTFQVQIHAHDPKQPLIRCTVSLTPSRNLMIPYWPRDLYPLDAKGSPTATAGTVHAAQRGLNAGIIYLTMDQPRFGSLLYFQNFTALNDYFLATETIPDGRVGGQWPELGYALPVSTAKPLPSGKSVTLCDTFLHWSEEIPENAQQSARLFLELLAGIYICLERPKSLYYDWPRRAQETLRGLQRSPKATIKEYGQTFLHPYTASEYPDSMVQLTVLMPLREYAEWRGSEIALTKELRAGVTHFFDPQLNTVRRYLPNVGEDKDADEVDSWYLYHPLANLARLAKEGDTKAKDMFLQSLDFGIKVARHFHYQWPVQFNVRTLDVITGVRKPDDPGQSDAGSLYAYVMLEAWDLTADNRYLEEAKKAIQAVRKMGFELLYQANITAWGANACLRLWKITGEKYYLEQSYVFLASFFHNTLLWESQIGAAKHYPIFLGVTCLHDGPYMAMYECFESFASFHEYLSWGEDDLPSSVKILLTEYCKYTLSRAWYYYPMELPPDILSKEVRNGHIDRKLAFPLEDLYADGQPAGQVGQEIYGCGAAFAFVTRAYHRLKNAPFLLYSEYPVYEIEETNEPCISFRVRGSDGFFCRARLIPEGAQPLPDVEIHHTTHGKISRHLTEEGHWEFRLPAGSQVEIRWK